MVIWQPAYVPYYDNGKLRSSAATQITDFTHKILRAQGLGFIQELGGLGRGSWT